MSLKHDLFKKMYQTTDIHSIFKIPCSFGICICLQIYSLHNLYVAKGIQRLQFECLK